MRILITAFASIFLTTTAIAQEESTLPASVAALTEPLEPVGTGTYRKLGFTIYHATLWAPGGEYNKAKPYALQIHYTRSLSKETVVDAVKADMHDQKNADAATLEKWDALLEQTLPAVKDGDEIIGISIPKQDARLFYNGKQIAQIKDPAFTNAFFNIWLGNKADPDMKTALLNR